MFAIEPRPSSSQFPPLQVFKRGTDKPMQASKWLSTQALLDGDEMTALFDSLGPFGLYQVSGILKSGEGQISQNDFLDCYRQYVETLKSGGIPVDESYRKQFSTAMTTTPDALYALDLEEDRQVVKIARPVVQQQVHRLDYSTVDGKFRPMVLGPDSILWGIQYSYPQLFSNQETLDVQQVNDSPDFPNTALFRSIQKWIRHNTIPTPFLVGDQRINVPMRLGKKCLSWINQHPQFSRKGLKVLVK